MKFEFDVSGNIPVWAKSVTVCFTEGTIPYEYNDASRKEIAFIPLTTSDINKEPSVKDGPEFWGLEGDDFILWNSIEERIEEYLDDFDESIFGPLPETLELIGYDPDPPRAENYEGSTLERLLEWLDENHKMDGEFTEETEGMKQAAHEFVEKVLSEYSSTSLKELCKKTVLLADYKGK